MEEITTQLIKIEIPKDNLSKELIPQASNLEQCFNNVILTIIAKINKGNELINKNS